MSAKAPYGFNQLNKYYGLRNPSEIHSSDTGLSYYFMRYLVQKCTSVFRFENIPEHWDRDYFIYTLFCRGYVAIINTDKYGVIPQECGLTGLNVFRQPNRVTIANPLLRMGELQSLVIHENTEIIKLQPDYGNITDICGIYADMMALCLSGAAVSIYNSKLAYAFFAEDKQLAESFKKAYDQVSSGAPFVVVGDKLSRADGTPKWENFFQNVGQNYIADKILDDMKKLEDRFNTDIGIPNANTQKRERLISDEVNANNVDTQSKVLLWLETMQDGIQRVNDMFGLNLSVSYRYEVPEASNEAMEVEAWQ